MQVDIGVVIGVGGFMLAIFGYVLNRDRDRKKDITAEAKMEVTLAHISKGVDDIKVDVRTNKEQMNSMTREIAIAQESVKSAHKRIDKLEGINHEN